ncbi:MAG: M12 family metallo-peptidase [Bacteroidota bacterium]
MVKNLTLRSLVVLFLLPITSLFAGERTPVETFIYHVKQTNEFVPVGNIWQADKNFDQTEILESVSKAQPLSVDYMQVAAFMKAKSTAINLVIPATGGGTYTLELARYDFFTNDFQVHDNGATDKKHNYTPGLYYSGVVQGIPGSVAAFSFFNNEIYGIFSIPGEGNYVVAPNTLVGKSYDYNTHYIVYNEDDLKIKHLAPKCGTDELKELQYNAAGKTTTTPNNKVLNNCTEVRCFEVADYAMYLNKGSNVTTATNYITSIFNVKATLYRNEGIPIVLKYVQVNSVTDQYQTLPTNSSSRWLNKFGWVTQNTMHGCDIATLFTTKGGGMGGVAWLGLMCNGYWAADSAGPYAFCNINTDLKAFPLYSWNVEVATHEMGHGLGSPHTHRCCWNTGRNTAIDGCYTIEGSCPNPGVPSTAVKGTIMSYCHLVSAGISFTNGFGQQPGDTIRYFLKNRFSASCGEAFHPNTALSVANKTITANRECTEISGGVTTTYYWHDNNSATHADDTAILAVIKNGNNIGNLNTTGFSVSAGTLASYGGGTGQPITFPVGTAGLLPNNMAMRRFWKMTPTSQPTSAVEVIFPFLQTDINDVNGSIPGTTMIKDFKMYKVNAPVDATPGAGFSGAAASSFTIYSYDPTASTTKWSYDTAGGTFFAHMKMTSLNGGGGFYTYTNAAASIGNGNTNGTQVYIYPNPTSGDWNITITQNANEAMAFQLYAADGRMVSAQTIETGDNTISAGTLPAGVYFYRIICNGNIYKGSLVKE